MTVNMKCVVIGGGSGFVGTALAKKLASINVRPVIVSRKPRGNDQMSWQQLTANGFPPACLGAINLAGANIGNNMRRWTPAFKKEVYDSRVETTQRLADLFRSDTATSRVFITASGVGYYPPSNSTIYTEECDVDWTTNFFSKLCHDWEMAGNLPESSIHRRVIIRTGVVLGRRGGIIQQIYLPFALGFGGPLGSGNQPFPWIHIDDIVGIYVHALTNDRVAGVLNGVAPELATNLEFTKAFGGALNRPTLFRVPEFLLNTVYGQERTSMIVNGQKVLPQRTIASGYQFKFPDIKSATQQLVVN